MSKKGQKPRRHRRPAAPAWVWPIGGILLLIAAILYARSDVGPLRGAGTTPAAGEVSGRAAIWVDQERIDYGDVQFNVVKRFVITVTNVGDEPLQFSQEPYIEIVEGC